MGNTFTSFVKNRLDRLFKAKKKALSPTTHILVIHYDSWGGGGGGRSDVSFLEYLKEREISFEDYICSFFSSTPTSSGISTHIHHIVSSLGSTTMSFQNFLTVLKHPNLHTYQYFTFGENDETEEFASSHVKKFSLILIPSVPPPFLLQNNFTVRSLETVLKDEGAIVASGFAAASASSSASATSAYQVGTRFVVMDYPSSVYRSKSFLRFFKGSSYRDPYPYQNNEALFWKR